MKTAEGMVEYAAPQVRDTGEPFVSAVRKNLAGRTVVYTIELIVSSSARVVCV